jgi:RES domain-containing protein
LEVESHPEFATIEAAVRDCAMLIAPWSGQSYRSAAPRYAKTGDMVTGAGSGKLGGRWNPPGSFRTVYASLEPEAAMAESLATFRYFGWELYAAMPRIFRALEVSLSRVLDLRRPRARLSLAPFLERAGSEDWRDVQRTGRESTSQAIGRAAFASGIEALLVPSFASPRHTNLAAFPEAFAAGSILRVLR